MDEKGMDTTFPQCFAGSLQILQGGIQGRREEGVEDGGRITSAVSYVKSLIKLCHNCLEARASSNSPSERRSSQNSTYSAAKEIIDRWKNC